MELRADRDSHTALVERAPADLAAAYRAATLPARWQDELSAFLARYGFRSIGVIDVGVARWSEDPTHILGVSVATESGADRVLVIPGLPGELRPAWRPHP